MSEIWLKVFREAVAEKGSAQVARELGVSPATVSLVNSGQYGASTKNIEQKVKNIYGNEGKVHCPIMGRLDPEKCLKTWQLARKIGVVCGNPETMRLYKACRKCELRNG